MAVALAACSFGGPETDGDADLTIFAAASLRDVMADLEREYMTDATVSLTFAFDASNTLRTQIEHGAPADVFLSADELNANVLDENGQASGAPVVFTANRLAIIVPEGHPAGVDDWPDLARPGVRIIGTGAQVPIEGYASELIERLGALPEAPRGYADGVRANILSREDNVRAVLARIELEEGDAGIVYATDARSSDAVRMLPLPEEVVVVARYAGVVMTDSPRQAAARAFLDWLGGPEATAVFASHGFGEADP